MTTFKDQLERDIHATFLNPLEFADMHNIDGRQVNCVVDSDEFRERNKNVEGTFPAGVVIFIKRDLLPKDPLIGQRMRVDGELYFILQVELESGMLIITLEANES